MLKKTLIGLIGILVVPALMFAASAFAADDAAKKALYDKHCKKCHAEDGGGKKADGSWMPVAKTLKLEKPEGLSILSPEAKKITDDDIKKSMKEGKGKMKK